LRISKYVLYKIEKYIIITTVCTHGPAKSFCIDTILLPQQQLDVK